MVWRLENFDSLWILGDWINQKRTFSVWDNSPDASERWDPCFFQEDFTTHHPFEDIDPCFRFSLPNKKTPYQLLLRRGELIRRVASYHPDDSIKSYTISPDQKDYCELGKYAVQKLSHINQDLDIPNESVTNHLPNPKDSCHILDVSKLKMDWEIMQKHLEGVFHAFYVDSATQQANDRRRKKDLTARKIPGLKRIVEPLRVIRGR